MSCDDHMIVTRSNIIGILPPLRPLLGVARCYGQVAEQGRRCEVVRSGEKVLHVGQGRRHEVVRLGEEEKYIMPNVHVSGRREGGR